MGTCTTCGQSLTDDLRFCTACGTPVNAGASSPVPPLATAPDTLAGSGAANGPAAPAKPGALNPPTAPAAPLAPLPPGTPPPPARRRLSGGILAGVLLAVLALGLGGFAVWKVFFSDDSGADSPEEAVTQLLEAGADQDAVAALRMLHPDEVRGADEVYAAFEDRMNDAGMTDDDGAVTGTSFSVKDLDVEVEELSEHAAKVSLTGGTVEVTVDFDQLPAQLSDVAQAGREEFGGDLTREVDLAELREEFGIDEAPFLITVEVDGRWYVSPTATIAEYLSLDVTGHGGDWAAYEEGLTRDPRTADSPEGALTTLAEAFRVDDLAGFLDALPAGQANQLRPYLDLLQSAVDGAPPMTVEFQPEDVQAGAEEDGLVRVDLRKASVRITSDADPTEGVEAGVEGLCFWGRDVASTEEGRGCLPAEVADALGQDTFFVMVRKVDDGWQLDPLATVVAWADAALGNISSEDVMEFLDLADSVARGSDAGATLTVPPADLD